MIRGHIVKASLASVSRLHGRTKIIAVFEDYVFGR